MGGSRMRKLKAGAALLALCIGTILVISCPNPAGQFLRDTVTEAVQANMPEMSLLFEGQTYASGSEIDIGYDVVGDGAAVELIFTVSNSGPVVLHLTETPAVVLQNQLRSGFTVASQPPAEINPGDRATFRIEFEPTDVASVIALVTIANDDPNENPYQLTLTGRGVAEGTLLSPNGGEAFAPGHETPITWVPFGGGQTATLELYRGGSLDSTITSGQADDGLFNWTIPGGTVDGTDYRVRILGSPSGLSDESDSDFWIGDIEAVSVSGPGVYTNGETRSVTWDSGLGGTVTVDLYDNGVFDQQLGVVLTSTGSFDWTISSIPDGDRYTARVTCNVNNGIWGQSSEFAVGAITNVAPSGGAYEPGGSYDITWNSVLGGTVDIDLYRDGAFDSSIAVATANDGSLEGWTVPAAENTGYRIRVTSAQNTAIFGQSADPFVIGTISVSDPALGEQLLRRTEATTAWSSVVGGLVHIDLYKGGVFAERVASNRANGVAESHLFVVSADREIGDDYRVRVVSAWNSNLFGESDEFRLGGWEDLGYPIVDGGTFDSTTHDIAVDVNGVPHVIGTVPGTGTSVLKYTSGSGPGTVWTASDTIAGMETWGLRIATDPAQWQGYIYALSIDDASGGHPRASVVYSHPTVLDYGFVRASSATNVMDMSMRLESPVVVCYQGYQDLIVYQRSGSWSVMGTLFDYSAHIGGGGLSFPHYYPSIATGPNNLPVVAFLMYDGGYSLQVSRYVSGTSWSDLDSPGTLAAEPDVSVGADNVPVIAFRSTGDDRIKVIQHDGVSGWTDLGTASGSETGEWPVVAVDSSGVPYVAYEVTSGPLFRQVAVVKYGGGTGASAVWEDLGHWTANPASYPRMVIDATTDLPVLVHSEWIYGEMTGDLGVKRFREY